MCADSYSVSVPPPVLPQWHVKDPGHSAKSEGGRLHLNTRATLTQRSRKGLTMPLSRHGVGTYAETSSHMTCQGTFGHSRSSSLSHPWTDFMPRSGELRTQKLKSHLVRTQSLNVLPLKPGVGQYIAIHATLTARDFSFLLISTLPVHSPAFFPKPLPIFPCVGCG